MKELTGHISRLKYQLKEYVPNSLDNRCTNEQREIIDSAVKSMTETVNDLDYYVHNKIALALETSPIIEQIMNLSDAYIRNGVDPEALNMTELDFNRIINIFAQQLQSPHNEQYFMQILQYAINLWIFEKQNGALTNLGTS